MSQAEGKSKIHAPSDVTTSWLGEVLGHGQISDFQFTQVGTGQMSECFRFTLTYASGQGPKSIILKVAAQDPKSRHAGVSLGLYQREIAFYTDVAPTVARCVPHCYLAAFYPDTDTFCLVLEDAVGMQSGDDIVGSTLEQAKTCLSVLGKLHGTMLRTGTDKFSWLRRESPLSQAVLEQLMAGFAARYQDKFTPEEMDMCSRLVKSFDAYKQQSEATCSQGLIHGDFRLDNILLDDKEETATIVDWQTNTHGALLGDVAYFLGCALPTDLRRAHQTELIQVYHSAMGPATTLTLAKCHEDLKHQAFFGIVMGVASSILVQQTERGDQMFITMIKRCCALVQDLDATSILPEPASLKPLQPEPADESLHPRTDEPLFNESYYFDFVDPGQGIAAYVRLGITPNVAGGGWYVAVISRKDQPLVAIMDYHAPIPDKTLKIKTPSYEASHDVIVALETFHISTNGTADIFADPASIFRSALAEKTAKIALDLTFHTDGTPYQYRVSTRYEIPCLVSGTIAVDGESYSISKQVGQRDHSWGIRNWWNMDWCWSSLHFDDDLEVHGRGKICVGYLQRVGEEVIELGAISSSSKMDEQDKTFRQATLEFTPHGRSPHRVEVEAIAHGPLRLVSEEGAVAFFDRAWCKCSNDQGHQGWGWLEWNRVQE